MPGNLKALTLSTFILIFFSSCNQTKNKQPLQPSIKKPLFTDSVAILQLDTTDTWLFREVRPAPLTQIEIHEIDTILRNCIEAYNVNQKLRYNSISKAHPEYDLRAEDFIISLSRYKRQYILLINSVGQKEVWVNCFCADFDNWKMETISVKDGGNCFFNLKINLSTKSYYQFMVNGDA